QMRSPARRCVLDQLESEDARIEADGPPQVARGNRHVVDAGNLDVLRALIGASRHPSARMLPPIERAADTGHTVKSRKKLSFGKRQHHVLQVPSVDASASIAAVIASGLLFAERHSPGEVPSQRWKARKNEFASS